MCVKAGEFRICISDTRMSSVWAFVPLQMEKNTDDITVH